jgi:hypothetical protein
VIYSNNTLQGFLVYLKEMFPQRFNSDWDEYEGEEEYKAV